MKDHPLKVCFPHGGKHYLLQWWTHSEQNKIVLAKSLNSIKIVSDKLIKNHYDFKYKRLLYVDIVAPPQSACEHAYELDYNKRVKNFIADISYSFLGFKKELGINLPSHFIECNNYLSNSLDESEDKEHYNCKNCTEKIALNGISANDFYEKFHQKWFERFPKHQSFADNDLLSYSAATQTSSLDNLHMALPSRGFSSGIHLVQFDDYYQNCWCDPCLFYFILLEELPLDAWINELKILEEQLKNKSDKDAENARLRLKRQAEIEYQKALSVIV